MSETTKTGRVKFYNSGKGFGFLVDDATGSEIFVHATDISGQQLNENDKVTFEIKEGKKGPAAANVQLQMV